MTASTDGDAGRVVVADGTGEGVGDGDIVMTVGVGVATVVAVVGGDVLVSTCASGFIVYDVPPGKRSANRDLLSIRKGSGNCARQVCDLSTGALTT